MYKILIKQEPKVCKKPKNPIIGYYESNFNGWAFYKECGKTIHSEDLSIIVEKLSCIFLLLLLIIFYQDFFICSEMVLISLSEIPYSFKILIIFCK